jgi:hypothetical protein
MRKIIWRCAIIAVMLIAVLCFSAPVRAEMPVGWVSDLILWYLEQNGVGGGQGGPTIVVLLPGTSFDSSTTPTSDNLVFGMITGANEHILYKGSGGMTLLGGESLDSPVPGGVYDQHAGTLFGAGSDIHYSFTQWICPLLCCPGTPFAYTNGMANTSEMYGYITRVQGGGCPVFSPENGFSITMDFYHNGLHYGVIVYNRYVGAECGESGLVFNYAGGYTAVWTNGMQPFDRNNWVNRGNGTNGH